MTTSGLTEQEVLLLAHHRDMVGKNAYGELQARYKAGRLVEVSYREVILVPNDGNNGRFSDR